MGRGDHKVVKMTFYVKKLINSAGCVVQTTCLVASIWQGMSTALNHSTSSLGWKLKREKNNSRRNFLFCESAWKKAMLKETMSNLFQVDYHIQAGPMKLSFCQCMEILLTYNPWQILTWGGVQFQQYVRVFLHDEEIRNQHDSLGLYCKKFKCVKLQKSRTCLLW